MVNHRKVQLCIWMFACCLWVNFGSGDFEWVRSRDLGRSWSVLRNDCWLLWDGQRRTSRPRICRSTASLAGVFLRVARARLLFSTDPIDCFLFPVVEMYLLCAPFFFAFPLYCFLRDYESTPWSSTDWKINIQELMEVRFECDRCINTQVFEKKNVMPNGFWVLVIILKCTFRGVFIERSSIYTWSVE